MSLWIRARARVCVCQDRNPSHRQLVHFSQLIAAGPDFDKRMDILFKKMDTNQNGVFVALPF